MTEETTRRVVTVNRGAEHSASQWPRRGTQHDALDAWVGRWINEGHVIDDDGSPGPTITTLTCTNGLWGHRQLIG